MSENQIPYIGSEGFYYIDEEEQKLWDNTLMDGLEHLDKEETIQKIRNYYNTCCDIDGRPPSKTDFNEFLNML
jgi:hypothetical protein